ncbi:Fatty acid desaturase [Popillia japonica]|uniref:Fatty acid desaturase n=1 Tax=Popillia japonica TaxID=7064 RepID=A0AAW1JD61_POPJA
MREVKQDMGTDITEAFEVHHIKGVAETLLNKYRVRKAQSPRLSPYTFEDDGFYRTLKRNVSEQLKSIPKKALVAKRNDFCYWFAAASGYFLASVTVAAHNYFHQKDNIRMYYFNFSLMNYREWRISHSLSHHLYTNTVIDLEMIFFEPMISYYPVTKSFTKKYLPWLYSPILWFFTFHLSLITRIKNAVAFNDTRSFSKGDLIPYILPLTMYLFGNQTLLHTFGMWTVVILCSSFVFSFIGINAAHHHPEIFHDGDTPNKDTDWGINQIDAVADRNEITGSHYLVLTNFGDHALHHMFPTLDQGLLQHIYPTFEKTLKQFNIDLRMTSQLELVKGQFLQMARCQPNPNPPSAKWTKRDS